jgi:hypothetical protein
MVTKVWMPRFPTFRAKSRDFGRLERVGACPEGAGGGAILLESGCERNRALERGYSLSACNPLHPHAAQPTHSNGVFRCTNLFVPWFRASVRRHLPDKA